MKITNKYNENDNMIAFLGSYLSNFYPCKIEINVDDKKYSCSSSEQCFMLYKAHFFHDNETFNKILEAKTPLEAKNLGRQVKNYDEGLWDEERYITMFLSVHSKFLQNKDIRDKLLATGDKILVEGNPEDTLWGVGLYYKDPLIFDKNNWKGKNLLGEVLMQVRKILRSQKG